MSEHGGPAEWSEGPPMYFVCVCVRRKLGFIGGPIGYEKTDPDKLPDGPIIVEHTDDDGISIG